jgi:hypothetical protein
MADRREAGMQLIKEGKTATEVKDLLDILFPL